MGTLCWLGPRAAAAETLCDPSFEDCRARLITLIRAERVGIDVAFWFMTDNRYTTELISRHRAGVPVRVIVDPAANSTYPLNADRLAELQNAGIPMRRRNASGILHWKMMLFDGQNTVQFSAANYSPNAWRPVTSYSNYTDEAIYFATDPAVVNSFRTKYDDLWTATSGYANYANVTSPARRYPAFTKDAALNFPPRESFRSRAVARYDAERVAIDVTMFRITDRAHTDAMIRAVQRGVRVRLYTEPDQYRDPDRLWHSWNVDRLYMAGVEVRHRQHAGTNHQKSVILHGQRMVIFGSSNWTSPSSSSQEEHNYFTTKSWIYSWFVNNFDRKWSNGTGIAETTPFVPLPPGRPVYHGPAHGATGLGTTGVKLRWHGGRWAHKYDVHFGTSTSPPLLQGDLELGPSESAGAVKEYTLPALQAGTTYYWRIVSRTMAGQPSAGLVQSFTTAGSAPAPPPPTSPGSVGSGDIVLYGMRATVRGGWTRVADSTAAGGSRLTHPDAGAAKRTTALASPTDYVELSFSAQGNTPYRLWLRMQAQGNHWANDSVFVQFSGSVTSSGSATWRIGTTSSTEVNLEDCNGCGVSGWGWQDNGWGVGVLGPEVRFASTGTQTIRIQTREDGVSIDQIVLSPATYRSTAPGALRNDRTILPETGGSTASSPPPPSTTAGSGDVVLHAGDASRLSGAWRLQADATAAGGRAARHPDAGGAKRTTAFASPTDFFELRFEAQANVPYHLWVRGRADGNHWANDSVFVQFSNVPELLIGTTAAAEVNIEDCSGCRLSGWGWQDNGWGVGIHGPHVTFRTGGLQTLRVQTREDGLAIDQILLSPSRFLTASPGALKNDSTIFDRAGGV